MRTSANRITIASIGFVLAMSSSASNALPACENPEALGTSRVIEMDLSLPRVGTLQYPRTLPLEEHEIVLSFDDGPIPPGSTSVLQVLAAECVKATFFALGENAAESPEVLREALLQGHTIGTHTQTHANLAQLSFQAAKAEIEKGIASVQAALKAPPSPFFRPPFLAMTPSLEGYLISRGLMLWSIDFQADDWLDKSPDAIVELAMKNIEAKGRGILLLHDIHGRTAAALPKLLVELKRKNFKIVHVVPAARLNTSVTAGGVAR